MTCGVTLAQSKKTSTLPPHTAAVPNRAPLASPAFVRLPLGSVRAEGWLLRQMKLQKAGLTGSAETVYDALTPDSGWLGGGGENWEKGPYYVRGLVALAHTLDDPELKQRAQKWIDWTLQSQRPDGFFGPKANDDWWPRMVMLYVLMDHYEATGDARVVPFLQNYFRHQLEALPGRPLRDWGRSRAGDNIDVVLWTYNRTGDASLLDLAELLYAQAYPWTSIFTDNRFYAFGEDFQPQHIVNVSQALKMPVVSWQFTRAPADLEAYAAGLAHLDRQYGRIDGQVSGTEMLSGLASTDGVELCADIERIISDGIAAAVTGDAGVGDRMEKIAYNSLPAHTSPRMEQITYYQLINQVTNTDGGHGFKQDYGNGNVPGPHSGFPCCCYNWHAGWPKFVQHMWAGTPDGGLALIAYGPNRVSATVAGGVPVVVTQTTDYPFKETVTLKINPQKPAAFPLVLRVPAWSKSATVAVNGKKVDGVTAGAYLRVQREWRPGDVVTIEFPMTVRKSTWTNGSAGLERGPLAFALKIKEDWKKLRDYPGGFDEYEVLPKSPWNYAIRLNGDVSTDVAVKTRPVPEVPFSNDAPPVTLTASAQRLSSWSLRASTGGTVLLGRSDHAWTPLAETAAPLEAGKPHRVRVVAKGATLRVFVDDMDRALIERDDATFATGGIGLRTYDAAAAFDNVSIDGKVIADFARNDAGRFKPVGGEWTVRDGALRVKSAREGKTIFAGTDTLRDFTLDATVTVQAGGNAGLLLRVTDATNAVDGYRGYYVGLAARKQSQNAQEPPPSPVTSDGRVETIELIPFGSGKLRVCYFPVLK